MLPPRSTEKFEIVSIDKAIYTPLLTTSLRSRRITRFFVALFASLMLLLSPLCLRWVVAVSLRAVRWQRRSTMLRLLIRLDLAARRIFPRPVKLWQNPRGT